ncbi:MAG: hypothetical protein R3A78_11085 [Polyangiales bacterium]
MISLRHTALVVSFVAVFGAASEAAADVVLSSEDGFEYEVQDYATYGSAGGEIRSGGRTGVVEAAFSSMFKLEVNDVRYTTPSAGYSLELAGRQLALGEAKLAGLFVSRRVYVPAATGEFVRYLDVIRNPLNKSVVVTVTYSGRVAYGSSPRASSSGDATVGANDLWFTMDDDDAGAGNVPAGFVIGDAAGTSLAPSLVSASSSLIEWQFEFVLPAYGQRAFLVFGVQAATRTAAALEAERLVTLPADAVAGIDAYLSDVVNYSPGGAPVVRANLPYTLPEGMEVPIALQVVDRENDAVAWSWDLDGNGVYGDSPNVASISIPEGVTDGNRAWQIGVRATDGVHSRDRIFVVNITNVAPQIESLPDLRPVSLDEEYVYAVDAFDPAVVRDPLTYTLVEAPEGASVSNEGRVTWTPTVADRGSTATFKLEVTDGDGGLASQEWSLTVVDNRVPTSPEPIAPVDQEVFTATPTLRARNGSDPDGDPLLYRFRLDRLSTFDSPSLLESADLRETTDETAWTVPIALEPGVWYWQVRVFDGYAESKPRGGRFVWARGMGKLDLPDGGQNELPIPDVGAYEPRPQCSVARGSVGRAIGLRSCEGPAAFLVLMLSMRLVRRRRVRP